MLCLYPELLNQDVGELIPTYSSGSQYRTQLVALLHPDVARRYQAHSTPELAHYPDHTDRRTNYVPPQLQELINTQFTKDDAAIDFIRNLLDSDEILHLADTDEGYITAAFLSARIGREQGDFMNTNFLSRKLSSLVDSPTFPYKLRPQRKRLPQLLGSEQLKLAYMSGITNTQMMVNGYIVRKK